MTATIRRAVRCDGPVFPRYSAGKPLSQPVRSEVSTSEIWRSSKGGKGSVRENIQQRYAQFGMARVYMQRSKRGEESRSEVGTSHLKQCFKSRAELIPSIDCRPSELAVSSDAYLSQFMLIYITRGSANESYVRHLQSYSNRSPQCSGDFFSTVFANCGSLSLQLFHFARTDSHVSSAR